MRVEITSIRPAVTINGAHADIQVVMCTLRPGLTAAFMTESSLSRWCSSVRPFTPGRYRLSGLGPSGSAVLAVDTRTH
jgi:hypothetical protein